MILEKTIVEKVELNTIRLKNLSNMINEQKENMIVESYFFEVDNAANRKFLLKLDFNIEEIKSEDVRPNQKDEIEEQNSDDDEDDFGVDWIKETLSIPEPPKEKTDHIVDIKKNHGIVKISLVVVENGIFHMIKESETKYNEKLKEIVELLNYKKCLDAKTIENIFEFKQTEQAQFDPPINYLNYFKPNNIHLNMEDIFIIRRDIEIHSLYSVPLSNDTFCIGINLLNARIYNTNIYDSTDASSFAKASIEFMESDKETFHNIFTLNIDTLNKETKRKLT